MYRPAVTDILKKGESYYSLVVAVAKRAREIAEEAEKRNDPLTEKSVQIAVEQIYSGKYYIKERTNIGENIE